MVCGRGNLTLVLTVFCYEAICFFINFCDGFYGSVPDHIYAVIAEVEMNFQNIENVYYFAGIMSSILIIIIYFLFMREEK